MSVTIEIEIRRAPGEAPETVTRTIDPDALSLGFLEDMEQAQETKRWRDLTPAYASLLGLTREQARALTVAHIRQISGALNGAAQVDPTSA